LKTANAFNPSNNFVVGAQDDPIGNENTPLFMLSTSTPSDGNSYNTLTTKVAGRDNYIDRSAYAIDINGDDNSVSPLAKNITITGNRNFIEGGVENVTLINTNDLTVSESNVTYIDGKQTSGDGSIVYKDADFRIEMDVQGYEVDTSSGDVTARFVDAEDYEGQEVSIKKISNDGYKIGVIGVVATQTLDDSLFKYITKYNSTMVIYSNGTNWKIK